MGTNSTVREVLTEFNTIILEVLLVESAVVSHVAFDSDPKGTISTLILSFSGMGFSCGCGLDKVDILEARKMINKQNCATKTLEG